LVESRSCSSQRGRKPLPANISAWPTEIVTLPASREKPYISVAKSCNTIVTIEEAPLALRDRNVRQLLPNPNANVVCLLDYDSSSEVPWPRRKRIAGRWSAWRTIGRPSFRLPDG